MERRITLFFIVLGILSLFASTGRCEGNGVIFYAGFEGKADIVTGYVLSADATTAAGDRTAKILDGELKFEPGKRGNALLVGDGCAKVRYDAAKNILPRQGTLELWLCAKDWKFTDGKYHVFFEAYGPDGSMMKFFKTPVNYYCNFWIGKEGTDAQGKNRFTITDPSVGFEPGRWIHLVLTWGPEGIAVYCDGERVKVDSNPILPTELTQFIIGDRPLEGSHGAHTLIDELYIYDRPLNEREIQWIYKHAGDREPGKDLPAVIGAPEASLTCVPSQKEIRISVNTGANIPNLTGTATLLPAAGTEAAILSETGPQKLKGVIRYQNLPPGNYTVSVVLKDSSGSEIGKCAKPLVVPDASLWLGNSIGISETPPPPWTPVKVQKDTNGALSLSCWGRTYQLGTLGLPAEIVTRGEQILASPIKLLAGANGQDAQWRDRSVHVAKSSDVQVVMASSATSDIGSMTWTCTAEYDGLLRYDLEFKPKKDIILDKFELHFPLKSSNARLMWTRDAKKGLLPEGKDILVQQPWNPYIWLGDEDRGLVLFCESESAWQEVDGKSGFLLQKKDQGVEVVWRFANAGVPWNLTKPWKFTFGIEATPVKDATVYRRYHLYGLAVAPPGYHNVWVLHDSARPPGIGPCKYFGYPEPSVPIADYRSYVANMQKSAPHESGPCLVDQYSLALCLSGRAPEAFYAAEWSCSPYPNGQWADESSIYGTMFIIAPTPAWRDFIVWKMDKFMRETGVDGIYSDFTMIMVSDNPLTGFPYDVRAGTTRQYFPFFATRELYKRIYTMHKQHNPDAFFFGHVANQMFIPYAAFMDGVVDGEHLNAEPAKDYPELLPQDLIQVQYAGKNLGVCTYFLPLKIPMEQRKNWETASEPYMISMSLLYDYGLWHGSWVMKPICEVEQEFGIAEAEFIPYWRSSDLIGGQNDAIKCSIYRKEKAGALIVVSNLTRSAQNAELSVAWERLKGPGELSVSDTLAKKVLPIQDGKLKMDLPPFGYRLVWVK